MSQKIYLLLQNIPMYPKKVYFFKNLQREGQLKNYKKYFENILLELLKKNIFDYLFFGFFRFFGFFTTRHSIT
jgi:hypothetical protein